jgi:hypothetical protein
LWLTERVNFEPFKMTVPDFAIILVSFFLAGVTATAGPEPVPALLS